MKTKKRNNNKSIVKPTKVLKPLNEKQLERIVGGPDTTRGTETIVQHG